MMETGPVERKKNESVNNRTWWSTTIREQVVKF